MMQGTSISWPKTIAFLKEQADEAYVWDDDHGYWAVKDRWHYWDLPPRIGTPPVSRLRGAFDHAGTWHKNHPGLRDNFMMVAWPSLGLPAQKRIETFFADHRLTGLDFLDH